MWCAKLRVQIAKARPKRAKAHRSAPRRAVGPAAYSVLSRWESDQFFAAQFAGCRAGCPASVRIARRRLSRVALYGGAVQREKKSILPVASAVATQRCTIGLGQGLGRSMKLSKNPRAPRQVPDLRHPGPGCDGGPCTRRSNPDIKRAGCDQDHPLGSAAGGRPERIGLAARFRNEAQAAGRLDASWHRGRLRVRSKAMSAFSLRWEYVEGSDLREYFRAQDSLRGRPNIVSIMVQLLDALWARARAQGLAPRYQARQPDHHETTEG